MTRCVNMGRWATKSNSQENVNVKTLTILLLGIVALSSSFAFAVGNEGSGGGAACVDQKGNPITLYYCGAYNSPIPIIPTQPAPPLSTDAPSENPPELAVLEKTIAQFPYLEKRTRAALLEAIKPSFIRKYFTASAPPNLTAPLVARIKGEFQRATGIDPIHLELYAITDTNAHISNYGPAVTITYLLPLYTVLPTTEQKVVALFHESLWALAPNATYETIVDSETAFEAVLAKPNDTARLLDFVSKIDALVDSLDGNSENAYAGRTYAGLNALLLKSDMESGALSGFLTPNGEFTNLQLFGQANIKCFKDVSGFPARAGDPEGMDFSAGSSEICAAMYMDYLDGLRRTYPKSQFLARVGDEAKTILHNDGDSGTAFFSLLCTLAGGCAENDPSITNDWCDDYIFGNDGDAKITLPGLIRLMNKVDLNLGTCSYSDAFPRETPVYIQVNTDSASALKGSLFTVGSTPAPKPRPKK
jgi:hypothetical protein